MMNVRTIYIVDTSSFISLMIWNPIDIFPSVWSKLSEMGKQGLIIAPMEVRKELAVKDDDLADWTKNNHQIFKRLNIAQIEKVLEIQSTFPALIDPDKETPTADPFVIALALISDPQKTIDGTIRQRQVVTQEKLNRNRIKIPFVCNNYGVQWCHVQEMFRRERLIF